MRPTSRIFLAALLALSWSSLALADGQEPPQADAPTALESTAQHALDVAFEQAANQVGSASLLELPGPTSMDCQHPLAPNDFETCVVTVAASRNVATPAAVAHY